MIGRLIRIELAKLRTIGLPWGLLSVSSALTLLVALLKASRAGKHTNGRLTVGPLNTAHGLASVLATPDYATILALVLGVIVVTGEFRHATITATYLAFPNRPRVMAAKMLASGIVGALFGPARLDHHHGHCLRLRCRPPLQSRLGGRDDFPLRGR